MLRAETGVLPLFLLRLRAAQFSVEIEQRLLYLASQGFAKKEISASCPKATQSGRSAAEAKYLTLRMDSKWLIAWFLSGEKNGMKRTLQLY